GLKDKVIFLGFRNDINELINICNIGVLLSYREGLPRNLMELMACGKKVIATNIRGCRDIVVDETVGELVEVGDYEATAKAIEEQYVYGDNEFIVSKEVDKYDIKTINESLRLIYKGLYDSSIVSSNEYVLTENK
ncbi:glycosyltransferase, partial [uncultured Clostridium sp.]